MPVCNAPKGRNRNTNFAIVIMQFAMRCNHHAVIMRLQCAQRIQCSRLSSAIFLLEKTRASHDIPRSDRQAVLESRRTEKYIGHAEYLDQKKGVSHKVTQDTCRVKFEIYCKHL